MKLAFYTQYRIQVLSLVLFTSLFMGINNSAHAQFHEAGVFTGGMGFVGDVGETKGLNSISNLKFAHGIVYKYNIDSYISLRASFTKGEILADDVDAEEVFKQQRGLKFNSEITEFAAIVEYNFFKAKRGQEDRHHTPFVFAGLSYFSFNPQADYLGVTYDLQELGTEGQLLGGADDRYSLNQLAIPFGMGYKINMGKKWRFTAELNLRKTFTDYIDDASEDYAIVKSGNLVPSPTEYFSDPTANGSIGRQRASSNNTDWFYTTTFSLTYVIQRPKVRCTTSQIK